MTAAAYIQIYIRLPNIKFSKKDCGHIIIIMLTSM